MLGRAPKTRSTPCLRHSIPRSRDRHRYGKNSFHVVGTMRAPICCGKNGRVASGSAARNNAALPDRHGSLRRRTSPEPQARIAGHDARLMPAKYVRPIARDRRTTSMMPKRLRSRAAPDDEVRGDQDRGATGPAALHRVRERLVSQRTGIINQIRAFMLERGSRTPGYRFCARNCHHPCDAHRCLCPACCVSSRSWPATGAGWISASMA